MSMAMPMTVPTAAPVSIPPCMAEAITSSERRPAANRHEAEQLYPPHRYQHAGGGDERRGAVARSSVSLLRGAVESASRKK